MFEPVYVLIAGYMPQMMQGNIPVVSSGPPRGSGMYKYLNVGVQNANQVCSAAAVVSVPVNNQMSSNSFQSVDLRCRLYLY